MDVNSNGHSADLSASALLSNYNANIDLTLKITDLYQLAIKNYLNKNFQKSWDLVVDILSKPISNIDDELAVKVYKLYLSLYDLVLKQEFQMGQVGQQQKLHQDFQNGHLYTQLVDRNIRDPELYLIVFVIERSNELALPKLSSQLELCLEMQDLNDELKIFKLYVFNVLPYMDQYEKAEALIMRRFYQEDDKVKVDYINRLHLIRKDIQQKKVEQQQQQQQQQKQKPKPKKEQQVLKPVTPAPVTDEKAVVSTTPSKQQKTNASRRLVTRFTKIFAKFYRQNNNLLMLLLLLIGLLLSLKRNKRLLFNTLKMVFKVSYV